MARRPPFVVRTGELPQHEAAGPPPFDAERLSLGRDVGRAGGSRRLGIWRERLPSGRRTSFTHAHSREEELVYVLSGRPWLRWVPPGGEAEECELAPGDCAVFAAGTAIAHTIVNRSGEDVELLVVGERSPGDRVLFVDDAAYAAWHRANRPLQAWTDALGPGKGARAPAERIETERLVVRTWQLADTFDLLRSIEDNRAHLEPYMPWAHEQLGPDVMAARIAGWRRGLFEDGDDVYGVFEPDGRIVGGTGVHRRVGPLGRELGYWVDRTREGRGYVTEWCAALVRVCFEVLLVDRVEVHCDPNNHRSAAVARRLGFAHEVTQPRRAIGSDGLPRDTMIWTLYADAYPTSPAASAPARAWDALGRRLL